MVVTFDLVAVYYPSRMILGHSLQENTSLRPLGYEVITRESRAAMLRQHHSINLPMSDLFAHSLSVLKRLAALLYLSCRLGSDEI